MSYFVFLCVHVNLFSFMFCCSFFLWILLPLSPEKEIASRDMRVLSKEQRLSLFCIVLLLAL